MNPINIDINFKKNYIHHINNIDTEFTNKGICNIEYFVSLVKNYITLNNLKSITILELGTKRSIPTRSTHHKNLFKNIKNINYIMVDIEDGLDVDIVCDVHKLSSKFSNIDVIISFSGYEHFKYPLLASHEIMKSLKINGLCYIQSHQSFPLHGYPNDYFRFSLDAYDALFPKTMNAILIGAEYSEPVLIAPINNHSVWNWYAKSFANSSCIIQKKGPTPNKFIYDI